MTQFKKEEIFDKKIHSITSLLDKDASYDLIIGIPFSKETGNLPKLLKLLDEILQKLIVRHYLIVCVGESTGEDTLAAIKKLQIKHAHIEYLMPPEISGRGMIIRTFLEIANIFDADLIILNANMETKPGISINEIWLERLISPINGKYNMVFGSVPSYFGVNSSAPYFTLPVLESIYGIRISDASAGIYVFDNSFIEELADEAKFWTEFIDGYGFDFWSITRALLWDKMVCEVQLSGKIILTDSRQRDLIFYENAKVVTECIKRDLEFCLKERLIIKVVDIFARTESKLPDILEYPISTLLSEFKRLTNEFIDAINGCLPATMVEEIKRLSSVEPEEFYLQDEIWVTSIFNLLLEHAFEEETQSSHYLSALTALYNGRVASNILQINSFKEKIKFLHKNEQDTIRIQKINQIQQELTSEFWRQKPEMSKNWILKAQQYRPRLVPLGYMEYVPGRPVVVPKEIKGKDQKMVYVDSVFRTLRKDYEDKFENFIVKGLGLPENHDVDSTIVAVADFIQQLEYALDKLLPGDLTTKEGVELFANSLFAILPSQTIPVVSEEILRYVLTCHPPLDLMIPMHYDKISDFIANIDVRDAVSYVSLVEERTRFDNYMAQVLELVTPSKFENIKIQPLIIHDQLPFMVSYHKQVCDLKHLTGRLTIKTMRKGRGGKYPKLRYFTSILRCMGIARQFSSFMEEIIKERKNIGSKTQYVMLNSRGGGEFSANNLFENIHHQELVEIVKSLAIQMSEEGLYDYARLFNLMVEGYGLSKVLDNGVYLTCTAWSWAEFSFKGGEKLPNAISSGVEAHWFNNDFIVSMYRELGYDQNEINRSIFRFIEHGKGNKTLLDSLMSSPQKDINVVVQEITHEPNKPLKRVANNPILEPILENEWESKYVLNPGALRIKDKVYLFYRAVGKDGISRIGLAITDGYTVLERLPEPIFAPVLEQEKKGCEDPRVVMMDDRIWMIYTAYDGNVAQIAIASIKVEDFLKRNFNLWRRDGLPFENIWDKDGILFPEKIQGKYVLYHRIDPSMWAEYIDELGSYDREQHFIIMGPRPGNMWDSQKIGAGSQPIKTKYGWLLIYHGVDYRYVYRLGVILVDLLDPHKVLYRSPNAVLEPEKDFELGDSGAWVPNVVFTCGAVGAVDKAVLDDNDEILVYYGAADTSIGMAKATVANLIPKKYRIVNI
ncbi:MAG: glycosidase [Peptostreptococcaceae bacterium]|nr:glycosidase [Peptostreptococcaceae bacterium]